MKPEPLGFHYVAVDGPIGVGKTTLVELLARRLQAEPAGPAEEVTVAHTLRVRESSGG